MSAACRPGSRSTHCTHSSCSGAARPAGARFKTSFLFYFFSPALPPEMVLLGCLDDDDITSHYLLGRAFFQLTFFSCPKPHRASSQRAEVALGPPRGGASPLPSTSKSRMKIPAIQRFFFPPLPSLSSRQALIFRLFRHRHSWSCRAALDWVSMVWDGDRQSVRASAAGTALESIPHMREKWRTFPTNKPALLCSLPLCFCQARRRIVVPLSGPSLIVFYLPQFIRKLLF